jgi:hypothetical protein
MPWALRVVLVGGGVAAVAAIAVALAASGDSGGESAQPANVAVVWGNPIPRALFLKGVLTRVRAETGAAPQPGTPAYRQAQDAIMRQLVNDVVVVAEARRLGIATFAGPVAPHIVRHPRETNILWTKVYDYAARSVPEPRDREVVRATRYDDHDLPDLLNQRQLKQYYAWQARRDRVASRWFGRLFDRYRAHTTYAHGFRPSAA